MFKQSIFSSLAAFLMLIAVSVCQAQIRTDVTVETFGINGRGRPNDPAGYYFLQQEGTTAQAKIKISSLRNSQSTINVEKVGGFVYFYIREVSGSIKYLTYVSGNTVSWLEGKTDNAKWKEIAPVQTGGDEGWKSYVLSTNESLFLRHQGYVIKATVKDGAPVFPGDATWRIQSGMSVPPAAIACRSAYGKKQLQTYSVSSTATNNYFIGKNQAGAIGIYDKSNLGTNTILSLKIEHKTSKNCAVVIDRSTEKYLTTDATGNITLTTDEQEGSYWTVTPARQEGLDTTWFSLKSNHPSLTDHFLRHMSYILYTHPTNTPYSATHYTGDASWRFVEDTSTVTASSPTDGEIICYDIKYRKTAANDVEEFKNGTWRTVGRGVTAIACSANNEFTCTYNGKTLYYLGEPDKWSESAFTMSGIRKRVVCGGNQYFIMGTDNKVYEWFIGAWREIGRDVTDIGCDGTTFTCVHNGNTLRYLNAPNQWQQ